jgi:hypothetical protein
LESICRQLWISRSRSIGPKERPTTHFRHTHKLSLHSLSRLRKSLNQEKQRSSSSNSCHSPDRYTIEKKPDPEREREREREQHSWQVIGHRTRGKKNQSQRKSPSALQVLFFCGETFGITKRDEKKHTTITHIQSKKKRKHARTQKPQQQQQQHRRRISRVQTNDRIKNQNCSTTEKTEKKSYKKEMEWQGHESWKLVGTSTSGKHETDRPANKYSSSSSSLLRRLLLLPLLNK